MLLLISEIFAPVSWLIDETLVGEFLEYIILSHTIIDNGVIQPDRSFRRFFVLHIIRKYCNDGSIILN
jgi:hypothetical protein